MAKPLPKIKRVPGFMEPVIQEQRFTGIQPIYYKPWVWVYCSAGGGAGIFGPQRKTERGAINAWNRMVERMREGQ